MHYHALDLAHFLRYRRRDVAFFSSHRYHFGRTCIISLQIRVKGARLTDTERQALRRPQNWK